MNNIEYPSSPEEEQQEENIQQRFNEIFHNIEGFDSTSGVYTVQEKDNLWEIYSRFFEDMQIEWAEFEESLKNIHPEIDYPNINPGDQINLWEIFDSILDTEQQLEDIQEEIEMVVDESRQSQQELMREVAKNDLDSLSNFDSESGNYTIQHGDTVFGLYDDIISNYGISWENFKRAVEQQDNGIENVDYISPGDQINLIEIVNNLLEEDIEYHQEKDYEQDYESDSGEVEDYIQQREGVGQEVLEENRELSQLIIENFDNYDLETINVSDIFSLVYMESNFNHQAVSHTGSTGLFQITTNVIEDIIKHPERYDQDIIDNMLERNGFTHISQLRTSEARLDPRNSLDLGMLYLSRLEGWNNSLEQYQEEIIENYKENIYDMVGGYLEEKGVSIEWDKFENLFYDVLNNPEEQEKFVIFRNYNGDTSALRGEILEHRYYYAFVVYYMARYCF